jgi:hypothetical protein
MPALFSSEPESVPDAAQLFPGSALLRANDMDINRGSTKKKSRLLMVLPNHFSFLQGAEGQLGYLDKADTQTPDFVLPTEEGELRFSGKYVSSATSYITMKPGGKAVQCDDVFNQLLVFEDPVLSKGTVPTAKPLSVANEVASSSSSSSSNSAEDLMELDLTIGVGGDDGDDNDDDDGLPLSQLTAATGLSSPGRSGSSSSGVVGGGGGPRARKWSRHLGCSVQADPLTSVQKQQQQRQAAKGGSVMTGTLTARAGAGAGAGAETLKSAKHSAKSPVSTSKRSVPDRWNSDEEDEEEEDEGEEDDEEEDDHNNEISHVTSAGDAGESDQENGSGDDDDNDARGQKGRGRGERGVGQSTSSSSSSRRPARRQSADKKGRFSYNVGDDESSDPDEFSLSDHSDKSNAGVIAGSASFTSKAQRSPQKEKGKGKLKSVSKPALPLSKNKNKNKNQKEKENQKKDEVGSAKKQKPKKPEKKKKKADRWDSDEEEEEEEEESELEASSSEDSESDFSLGRAASSSKQKGRGKKRQTPTPSSSRRKRAAIVDSDSGEEKGEEEASVTDLT